MSRDWKACGRASRKGLNSLNPGSHRLCIAQEVGEGVPSLRCLAGRSRRVDVARPLVRLTRQRPLPREVTLQSRRSCDTRDRSLGIGELHPGMQLPTPESPISDRVAWMVVRAYEKAPGRPALEAAAKRQRVQAQFHHSELRADPPGKLSDSFDPYRPWRLQ